MTWKRTDHGHPTSNSHPASAAGDPPPPTMAPGWIPPPGRTRDVESRSARPRDSWGRGSVGGVSGDGHAHHAHVPSCWPSEHRWRAGAWGVSVTGRSGVGRGSGGNATSRRAGGCHTCDMPVNGRDKAIVGSMGRRCVSTSSSLNTTYVTDYTSSIGRTSSSRGARSIGVSMPALSSAR